jgi:hypothetical protein
MMSKKLLYPAGTRLRATRDFYPWNEGEIVTLAQDWHENETGITTRGGPGAFAMQITEDAVEPIESLRAQLDALLTLETVIGPDRDLAQYLLGRIAEYDETSAV